MQITDVLKEAEQHTSLLAAEAVLKEARQRQRKRQLRWLMAFIIAAVVAGLGAYGIDDVVARKPASNESPIASARALWPTTALSHQPLSDSVIFSGPKYNCGNVTPCSGRFTWINPGSGTSISQVLKAGETSPVFADPVVVGNEIVGISNIRSGVNFAPLGHVFVLQAGHVVRTLGLASLAYRSALPNDIWLRSNKRIGYHTTNRQTTGCSVREVSVSGRVIVKTHAINCRWTILGALANDLVVKNYHTKPQKIGIMNPSSDFSVQKIPGLHAAIQYGYDEIVESNKTCNTTCNLLVLGTKTPRFHGIHIKAPDGYSFKTPWSLSPNGKFIALVAAPTPCVRNCASFNAGHQPCCLYGVRPVLGKLIIADATNGEVLLDRSLKYLTAFDLVWSPNDADVFLSRTLTSVVGVPLWSKRPIKVITMPSTSTFSSREQSFAESFSVAAAPRKSVAKT